ncbi:MAG: hypothetical protein ACSLE0_04255, partial [Chitinophagaceae bacterium]
MKALPHYLLLVAILSSTVIWSQPYSIIFPPGSQYYNLELINNDECVFDFIGSQIPIPNTIFTSLTYTPEELLCAICDQFKICTIDQTTGQWAEYYGTGDPSHLYFGIIGIGSGIFYVKTYSGVIPTSNIFQIDINANVVSYLGTTPYPSFGDLTLFNGEI